jgi:hypothetical protein
MPGRAIALFMAPPDSIEPEKSFDQSLELRLTMRRRPNFEAFLRILAFGILVFGLYATPLCAITFEWINQPGTTKGEYGSSTFADDFGNIYISGRTDGALFGSSAFGGAFVARYNSQGNLIWARQFGPSSSEYGNAVGADEAGNVYVAGSTSADLSRPNIGGRDAYLRKYDPVGNLLWSDQFGTVGDDDNFGIAVDEVGNVYVSGGIEGDLGGSYFGRNDAFLRKYDTVGNHIWTRQLGTSDYDSSFGAAADGLGHVYITGHTYANLQGTNKGLSDAFVAKYDTAGNHIWTRQFGSIYYDRGNEILADSYGNIYVAGSGYANQSNAFVTKFNGAGNQLWTKQLVTATGDQGSSVSSDALGNVYIVGTTEGVLSGSNSGGWDAFVAKYDSTGNHQWTQQFGTAYDDIAAGIANDGAGNFYITGQTKGSIGGSNAGMDDLFLAKFVETAVDPPTVPPPGDFNRNLTVDAADYLVWRNAGIGNLVDPCSGADHNCNGVVDNQDVATWRSNFGRTASGSTAADDFAEVWAHVPEPFSLPTVVLGLLGLTSGRRRARECTQHRTPLR